MCEEDKLPDPSTMPAPDSDFPIPPRLKKLQPDCTFSGMESNFGDEGSGGETREERDEK